jgi:hypothetical protein
MSESFSTDLVPVSDRLEAWLCNAKPICGDCRFHFPRRLPFRGSIERRTLAGLALTRFASTPVSFAKFPIVAGNSEDRGCIVITQLEGVRHGADSHAATNHEWQRSGAYHRFPRRRRHTLRHLSESGRDRVPRPYPGNLSGSDMTCCGLVHYPERSTTRRASSAMST